MTTREQRLTKALEMVLDWTGIAPERSNSVIACGVRDILAGNETSPMVRKAEALVAAKVADTMRRKGVRR